MTLESLITAFRRDEGDNQEPYAWARDDLAKWFKEAQEEACLRSKLIFDGSSPVTTIALAAGESVVSVDPSVLEIVQARLVDSSGYTRSLLLSDRIEQDRCNSRWREMTGIPTAVIHDDKALTFNRISDAAYTVKLDVYRLPLAPLADDSDEPEIAPVHHDRLIDWVRYRAYSVPDTYQEGRAKSSEALAAFEDYFGRRPQANESRAQRANRPHRVKAW
jgi:hypothetical protein